MTTEYRGEPFTDDCDTLPLLPNGCMGCVNCCPCVFHRNIRIPLVYRGEYPHLRLPDDIYSLLSAIDGQN